jgi:hypothetical protein
MVCLRVAEEFAPIQDARIKKGTIHGTPKFGAALPVFCLCRIEEAR